jgi:hypothetical protein
LGEALGNPPKASLSSRFRKLIVRAALEPAVSAFLPDVRHQRTGALAV